MRGTSLITAAASIVAASAQAVPKGFNYGNVFTDGSPKILSDFEAEFTKAQGLAGTDGSFTSARLFTMIQAGTANTVISAIPAAINTNTRLLLGLWASAGQASFDNEIIALRNAINQYGDDLLNLLDGISIGSEDLYRVSPTGVINNSGAGANPQDLVNYIAQARAVEGVPAGSIGHVDTWTVYVNASNNAVIEALDWVGMDAYPYFQNTINNGIDVARDVFFDALAATEGAAMGKPVWVTETGWPVSGPTENNAIPSVENAETYFSQVGCALFGERPTWWYVLQDAAPTTPNPSFGVIPGPTIDNAPYYDLSCPSNAASSSAAASSAASTAQSTVAEPTEATTTAAESTVDIVQTPGPQTSPESVPLSPTASAATQDTSAIVTSGITTAEASVTTADVGEDGTSTYTEVEIVTVSGCPPSDVFPTTTVAASTPAAAATTSAAAAPSGDSCPASLSGTYEYPHLVVPVSSSNPNTAYGTSYNGTINSDVSTIFNFDLPAAYAGMTCSLVFLFPNLEVLTTSNFDFNGKGGISVDELSSPATEATTFENKPEVAVADIGAIHEVRPGNSYVVASHECNAGARQSFEFSSTGGLDLSYFQDYNDGGIGAYITVC